MSTNTPNAKQNHKWISESIVKTIVPSFIGAHAKGVGEVQDLKFMATNTWPVSSLSLECSTKLRSGLEARNLLIVVMTCC